MSLTLCSVCRVIFEGPLVLSEEQPHHQTPHDFLQAAARCYICRTITKSEMWKELERRAKLNDQVPPATWFLAPHTFKSSDEENSSVWYKLTIDHDWGERDGELYPPSDSGSDDLPDFYPDTPIWEFRVYPSLDDIGDEQDLPSGLEDHKMLDLPKKWYHDCVNEHPLCTPPDLSFRPTRLIKIVNDQSVRLIISKDESVEEPYIAFSHCWGKAKTLKLLQHNMIQLQSGINDSDLPTSYKEALLVCRAVGFHYIWIDSLCIIQDSFEDWQQEALTMKDVYQNSALNLCASAAAENSEASFASRDVSLIPPCKVSPSWVGTNDGARTWRIAKFDMYDEEVENSPLISRAWVVQEHFLSHRSLHMTKSQLWWGCRQQVACETFPKGYPKASMGPAYTQVTQDSKEKDAVPENKKQQDARWYKLVEDYARCGLTVATDKLIAFAGVAQKFTRIFPNDRYVAGMWRSQMPLALCWSAAQMSHTYRPRKYIAPSWSWASVKGVIQIPLLYDRVCHEDGEMKTPLSIRCKVLDVRVGLKDPRYETGQVSSGQLDLQAHLVGPVDWEGSTEHSVRISSVLQGGTEYEISIEEGGEVNFDETNRDGAAQMAWLGDATTEENLENERETASPPSFLLPIAEFSAESCDPPHAPATFGIIVCQVAGPDSVKYYRVGSFEHVVLTGGLLEAFPRKVITID